MTRRFKINVSTIKKKSEVIKHGKFLLRFEKKGSNMFEDIPFIYESVRILRFLSLLYEQNWRRYVFLTATTLLVYTQIYYIFGTSDGINALISNSYMLMLWFNTILRAYLIIYNGDVYKRLFANLQNYYYEFLQYDDPFIQGLITDLNRVGVMMARGNLFLGICTCFGFFCYPIFADKRVLPFGVIVPGIDEYKSPFYEVLYVYQVIITPVGCCMYIPYTSLIVSLIMFGIVMCKTLQYRLKMLSTMELNDAKINAEIIACIQYQKRIIDYVSTINSLTMLIFSVEFLAFGTLLCALLFLLIIVDSIAQTLIVCAYINMIFAQILALYWYANELREQNLAISNSAYETDWFTFPISVQKHIILLICRAQRPCALMIGNTYPMTLQLFQSLLNASYSYFTLLKRVYS